MPSLVGVADAPEPQWRHVRSVVAASTVDVDGRVVLVGHSGAGLLLPVVAAALSCPVAATIFVDAFLPPPGGPSSSRRLPLRDGLHVLANDGVLAPWSTRFGAEVMRELVPPDDVRARLESDMPRLRVSYFDGEPSVPQGWDRRPCAWPYLLLAKEPYAAAAIDAGRRGWPERVLRDAKHLHMAIKPEAVAEALLGLESALAERGRNCRGTPWVRETNAPPRDPV